MNNITILAIESSCDETSAAVWHNENLASNIVATQKVHEQYGGVVPELASRDHLKNIVPVVDQALIKANISKKELTHIAYTQGPGLLGALLVGSCFAQGLSSALGIPLVGVHHMKAHILAHFIDEPKPKFPFLCLTVSGGHTQIVLVRSYLEMQVVGQTLDDAVGEAFDKSAKLLGITYPGGPLLDKLAKEGDPEKFKFPEPDIKGLDFSFSGIKTAILYFLNKEKLANPRFVEENLPHICASIQHSLVKILLRKLSRASKEFGIKEIAIAGGVSANSGLRKELLQLGNELGWNIHIPAFEYCTDNAGMIACSAYYQVLSAENLATTEMVKPRWEM